MRAPKSLALVSMLAAATLGIACARGDSDPAEDPSHPGERAQAGGEESAAPSDSMPADSVAADAREMESQVRARLEETRSAALANPLSAEAWGRYGMVAHAHELWEEAAKAYRQAEKLDASDVRWHYYLGDVLSVQGTDLEKAVAEFRQAKVLRPDYAPLHMRLGNVLIALDRSSEAANELERALELAPELQQARVALAQVRLAAGDFDASQVLLEAVLAQSPRHGQALSTLGRVYMRQGKREEARAVAARAREAASYNLYSDPLMAKVVSEGVSAVQIWERAKGFLESGNFEQAVLGLRQVVLLQPDNQDAHLQLAVAYGNLGKLERSRYHLERTVALAPDLVVARVNLAQLLIQLQEPSEAAAHLQVARELDPDSTEVGWLFGRALLESGDLAGALSAFENSEPAALRAAEPIPGWVHNDWGRALAQFGDPQAALDHFRAALAENKEDPQAHFYIGLVQEGLGQLDDAVISYCRSMALEAGSPAAGRIRELSRACP